MFVNLNFTIIIVVVVAGIIGLIAFIVFGNSKIKQEHSADDEVIDDYLDRRSAGVAGTHEYYDD